MDGYEDDDDTHFCIKCHLTVNGLENYVRHRQSGCRPADDKGEAVHEPPSTPTTVSYPEILNADAFFNSLELQSSSKSNTHRARTLLESSRKSRKEDRKRKNRKTQADVDETTTKEKLHGMLPGVTDLDDPTEHLCIPSLVGFPDIVSSGAGKTSSSVGQHKLTQPSGTSSNAKIENTGFPIKHEPDNSLEGLIADAKQTDRKRQEDSQRIEQDQTWLEDPILADLDTNENKELPRYEFEYHQDEDSEDDIMDEDVVDEESYSESDDAEDREHPPRGHTGGKWKPGLDGLPQDITQDEEAEPEEDHPEHPPPTYTGGKWKPTEASHSKDDEYESKNTAGQPPPGHTRGKWVPGARADIDTGYWCNPCGRKLASRLLYNRHLLSDLHARRSIREIDGALHLPRGVNPFAHRKTSSRRQMLMAMKAKETAKACKTDDGTKKKLRRREKEVLTCEMCHARVRRAQMGKHLLSHYHCRVAAANPCGPSAQRFLLENIGNIVRQCPFQCASCRFYCNTEETFLLHWRSSSHAKTLAQIGGSYRCAPCDFWCEDNETMESHLLSRGHRDVVFMMNGSVPVVISRQRVLHCGNCQRRFRYNFQLRMHAKETGHTPSHTASDEYQQRITCGICFQVVRSMVSLQRHQLASHLAKESTKAEVSEKPGLYFCSFCSMHFDTPQEAVMHRRSVSHKEIRKAKKLEAIGKSTSRNCPHCGQSQSNLVKYKEHLLENHPELCHSCARCGVLFALPQDVTRHTKASDCSKSENLDKTSDSGKWRCTDCNFSTDSQSEFLFHEALHAGCVTVDENEASGSKQSPKYQCPVCKKPFAKVSLRNHIRSHTGERPFPCAKCFASFSRRSDLALHQKDCDSVPSSPSHPAGSDRRRSFTCSECNDAFYTKHSLRQHMLRHAGKKYKCGLPGCPTTLRTASELKSHRMLVHESTASDRQYPCTECSYAAKTKTQLRRHKQRHEDSGSQACPYSGCSFKTKLGSHLRRHIRLHTGTKPYKCPHCAYASNNLENLRKHVLSTNLHPGKTIYRCDFCTGKSSKAFTTNFSKELRAHLMENHSAEFPTSNHANTYVSQIFGTAENSR